MEGVSLGGVARLFVDLRREGLKKFIDTLETSDIGIELTNLLFCICLVARDTILISASKCLLKIIYLLIFPLYNHFILWYAIMATKVAPVAKMKVAEAVIKDIAYF